MQRNWVIAAVAIAVVILIWLWFAPPQVWLNLTKRVDLSDPVGSGEKLVDEYHCRDCHRIQGEGALKAPDLDGVSQRLSDQELRLWLSNPNAVRRNSAMPDFQLSDTEIEALIEYLKSNDME